MIIFHNCWINYKDKFTNWFEKLSCSMWVQHVANKFMVSLGRQIVSVLTNSTTSILGAEAKMLVTCQLKQRCQKLMAEHCNLFRRTLLCIGKDAFRSIRWWIQYRHNIWPCIHTQATHFSRMPRIMLKSQVVWTCPSGRSRNLVIFSRLLFIHKYLCNN